MKQGTAFLNPNIMESYGHFVYALPQSPDLSVEKISPSINKTPLRINYELVEIKVIQIKSHYFTASISSTFY